VKCGSVSQGNEAKKTQFQPAEVFFCAKLKGVFKFLRARGGTRTWGNKLKKTFGECGKETANSMDWTLPQGSEKKSKAENK